MATNLMLPDGMAPTNLHLKASVKVRYIEGDVLDICERLAEVSPRLYLVELSEEDGALWCVMEKCDDGVHRMVGRYQELDARMIENVQYMLHVPFERRLAIADAENAKYEADWHENMLEEAYEKMGGEFNRMLWKCGFTDSRPTSYPTIHVATGGRRVR